MIEGDLKITSTLPEQMILMDMGLKNFKISRTLNSLAKRLCLFCQNFYLFGLLNLVRDKHRVKVVLVLMPIIYVHMHTTMFQECTYVHMLVAMG